MNVKVRVRVGVSVDIERVDGWGGVGVRMVGG